jgi:hypothetical protein
MAVMAHGYVKVIKLAQTCVLCLQNYLMMSLTHESLFVTISFKQMDHFHNLDKFKYSFIYRVSKKTDTFVIQISREGISVFYSPCIAFLALFRFKNSSQLTIPAIEMRPRGLIKMTFMT